MNKYLLSFLSLMLFCGTVFAQGELPLLERYSFDVQDWPSVELSFLDRKIGTGGAQFRLEIRNVTAQTSELQLAVFRHLPSDQIAFALLLEEIRVRFLDPAGNVVKAFTLDQILGPDGLFIIGDSQDGYFEHRRKLSGLRGASRLEVELLGNFE